MTRRTLILALIAAGLTTLLAAATASAQLIANNSFENSPIAGYTTFNSTLAQSTSVTNTPDGTGVAKVTWNGTSTWFSIDYDPLVSSTTAGQAYSATVKVEAQNANSVGDNITLSVRERTQSGTLVAEGKTKTTLSSSTSFQTITASYTVHNTGDKLDVYLQEGNTTIQAGSGYYADLISAGPPLSGTLNAGSAAAAQSVTQTTAQLGVGGASCPGWATCNIGYRYRQVGTTPWTYTSSSSVDCSQGTNCPFVSGATISGLTVGTQYEYQAAVGDAFAGPLYVGSDGTSSTTVRFTTTSNDTTPPSVPTGVTATAGESKVTLSWTASTDNVGVTGYNVYRNGTKVGSSSTTSYSDTGLTDGTTYSYTVTAYDAAGNQSAQSSPAVNATPVDTTAPSTPTGLQATPGDTTVALTWTASTDNVGVTGYDVYRNGTKVGTTSGTSYTDTGLTDGTQYTYTVDAYDNAGNTSARSSSVNATPTSGGGGARTVPANPSGPPIPSGGWSVEFGDAFQACITFTSTACSSGYPRTDAAWAPQTKADGNGNSNEKGVVAFEPSALDVTSQGFVTTCTQTANLGDSNTCGQMLMNGGPAGTNGFAPTAPSPFHFDVTKGTLAIQYEAQLPADQGNMDPGIWENGPSGTPEIDNAEYFGMHKQPSGSNTWCGMGWGFIGTPYGSSHTGNGDNEYWCQAGGPNFDPSTAEHTYTMYFSGGNYTGYIDGTEITSGTFTSNSAAFKLIAGMSMRTDTATGQVYGLPSVGAKLIIPYIAVYEATSNGGNGTNGPIIEPGTTVGP